MNVTLPASRPKVAMFLDIDGVLNDDTKTKDRDVDAVLREKFGLYGHRDHCQSGCLKCSQALAHLFEKSAVACLKGLIDKINEIAEVHIVISSHWRKAHSIEELKEIFNIYDLGKYIIDKTKEDCCDEHCDLSHKDFLLERWCRASEIKEWLNRNPDYLGSLIFDDMTDHLREHFGERFICTRKPGICTEQSGYFVRHYIFSILTQQDTDKAYQVFLKMIGPNIG